MKIIELVQAFCDQLITIHSFLELKKTASLKIIFVFHLVIVVYFMNNVGQKMYIYISLYYYFARVDIEYDIFYNFVKKKNNDICRPLYFIKTNVSFAC